MFVLTPLARTSPTALALAQELVAAVGATPLVLSAERHDALAAVSSHLPYAAAVTLMRAALAQDDDHLWALASSGFRDTSRLAASDLTMMVDILLTNRAALLAGLSRYRTELDALISLLEAGNAEALRAALAQAQAKRAELFQ
jgi:prephenate dehydrogenase